MTVLVTGASGHLGANLVRRLLADGERVRVLLREDSNNAAVDGLEVERVYGDLRDREAARAAVSGCERIFHCAALVSTNDGGEREIYDCNVIGTRHVLASAREAGIGPVVVTGSFSAVGHVPGRPSDELDTFYPFERTMPYEVSKAWVEHEVLRAVADGLDARIAISCAIIGANDFKPSRMGRVIRDFCNGKLLAYIPGGFEFVAARDIVEGHLLTMKRGRAGQRYIFSSEFLTFDELMPMLERISGRPRPRLRLPPALMAVLAEASAFVIKRFFPGIRQQLTPGAVRILRMHRRADTSRARSELGFEPTPIEQAFREAYDWFVARGEIQSTRSAKQGSPPPASVRDESTDRSENAA
jgi:nucleoside-diphosphate-sugar epimerase